MLRKLLSYFCVIFGLVALWASTSRDAMQYLAEKRDHNKWWGGYQMENGDLISMAHLDGMKHLRPRKEKYWSKPPADRTVKDIDLYLCGDSYGWRLGDTAFVRTANYHYIDRYNGGTYTLDTTKKNVLIIEIAERMAREYFNDLHILDIVKPAQRNVALITTRPNTRYASLAPIDINMFFNKLINQNLQYNLFNYNFMMPMFSTKAALNFYLFDRASGDVVISDNKERLFLKQTVEPEGKLSSYSPLSDTEVSRLAANLDTIYRHYKLQGFTEVYLAMIPNSATVMQPVGYNGLIPSIQSRLETMKVLDIYTVFRNAKEVYYLPGDTHWNNEGRQRWLDLVNMRLSALPR